MRSFFSCQGCHRKRPCCQDSCKEYIQARQKQDAVNARRRAYYEASRMGRSTNGLVERTRRW